MSAPDLPSPIAVEEIFRVTAALPVAERAAYLDAACEGYPAVRACVERMLEVQSSGAFLQQPPEEMVSPEIEAELARLKPEEGGERIGHYKLLQQLGEGGFGTVWMAEQERPVRRRVALKIIKLGMDTKEVIARFEQERQALALMDHPNIAKVFDAGATQYGRPFFVMELVKGVKITDYCDGAKLPTVERLKLFATVCQAMQHAHQKGIIHRDIKPSNIMVTLHDGMPVPKIIDFGVAKATQSQRLTDLTLFTQFEQMIGTPLYMSPEQAEMSGLDVDTRSDIYSLGVLLYELLTGRTPFDPEELMKVGHDEMRRVIREQEPKKPSTCLSTMALETRTIVAQSRQADGAKLAGLIRGDLDWIVMKALEKDRTRRYETAVGLARDIERHLASEPVLARPPSAIYQLSRFARRNKGAVGAALGMAALLIAGIIASLWQAVRATHAEDVAKNRATEADTARKDAQAISSFLLEVFQSPDPTRDGRTITVAETLDRAVKKLDAELATQPMRKALLQDTLSGTYRALGLPREAVPLAEKVRAYSLASLGPKHPLTLTAMNSLAVSYGAAGRRQEADKLQEEVLALSLEVNGPENPSTLLAMNNVGVAYRNDGRTDEALKLLEEVVRLRRKVSGVEHPDTLDAMTNLAICYSDSGRLNEALKLREEVLTLSLKVSGPEHPGTLAAMHNLADSYAAAGRLKEALKLREEVLALRQKVNGPEHPDTFKAMGGLADSYAKAGRKGEALKLREEVLALRRQVLGPEHPETLNAMSDLVDSYAKAGRKDEALKLHEEELTLSRKVFGPEHPSTLGDMTNLAERYRAAGRLAEAIELQEQSLAIKRRVLPASHPYFEIAMRNMANLYAKAGRQDEAFKLRVEVLALRRTVFGPERSKTLEYAGELAEDYEEEGRKEDALQLRAEIRAVEEKAENALPALSQLEGKHLPVLRMRGRRLARNGKWREAAADFQTCLKLDPIPSDWYDLAPLLLQIGDLTGYRTNRRAMLEKLGSTEDLTDMGRLAKASLLLPAESTELEKLATLAETAVTEGKDHDRRRSFQFTKALAEYRCGRFAESVTFAKQVLESRNRVKYREIQANAILAMAEQRLTQTGEAHAALAQADALAADWPNVDASDPKVDFGGDWANTLIGNFLLREAHALLD